jgi:hypothetical protein
VGVCLSTLSVPSATPLPVITNLCLTATSKPQLSLFVLSLSFFLPVPIVFASFLMCRTSLASFFLIFRRFLPASSVPSLSLTTSSARSIRARLSSQTTYLLTLALHLLYLPPPPPSHPSHPSHPPLSTPPSSRRLLWFVASPFVTHPPLFASHLHLTQHFVFFVLHLPCQSASFCSLSSFPHPP